jgi:Protein of unknown function (DUF732)
MAAPPTVTVTAPPPVTVTAAAPPEPKLEGVDAHFISFLRNNDVGSVYANVSNATAIANARLICTDMLHGTGFDNVANNLNLDSAQIAWFADTASASYCPPIWRRCLAGVTGNWHGSSHDGNALCRCRDHRTLGPRRRSVVTDRAG